MIQTVLTERLTDVEYDAYKAGELSEELVRMLRDAAKRKPPHDPSPSEMPMCRYKLLFQVILGEYKGQGLKITSKFIVNVSVCVNRQRDRNTVSHNSEYKNKCI